MTFSRWTGGAWTGLTTFKRWTGAVWQIMGNGSRWNGSSWVQFGFLQATLSPTNLSGSSATAGNIVTSASCTVTPTGGVGPFTYLWQITTNSGNTIQATAPTNATSFFFAGCNHASPSASGSAVCQVTDTGTGLVTTTTNNVGLIFTYTGP